MLKKRPEKALIFRVSAKQSLLAAKYRCHGRVSATRWQTII